MTIRLKNMHGISCERNHPGEVREHSHQFPQWEFVTKCPKANRVVSENIIQGMWEPRRCVYKKATSHINYWFISRIISDGKENHSPILSVEAERPLPFPQGKNKSRPTLSIVQAISSPVIAWQTRWTTDNQNQDFKLSLTESTDSNREIN